MDYRRKTSQSVEIEVSTFSENGTDEINLVVKPVYNGSFEQQLDQLLSSVDIFLSEENIPGQSIVFMRFFVSDYANQTELWEVLTNYNNRKYSECAVSVVQQPPLDGSKVSLWVYIVDDKENELIPNKVKRANGEIVLQRNNYQHLWSTHLTTTNGATESSKQTENIFHTFNQSLTEKGMLLKNNCIRTWLFVRDVDFNYKGVVEARKDFFEKLGMTKETHFISSTGIEGRHYDPYKNVLMDAYSVGGVTEKQVKFLEAPANLNPTHEYGVTFERGTSVDYGDRRHIFISGTASINNKGEVVYKRDIEKQIIRTFENITALLGDADAGMGDVSQMIIYLRDVADSEKVKVFFESNYKEIPKLIVLAPVCRPEWLIEIECIAIKKIEKEEFAIF